MTTTHTPARESSVVIMSRRFSFPDVGKIAKEAWNGTHIGEQVVSSARSLPDVGKIAKEAWNGTHIGEQVVSWEQQVGETWSNQHMGRSSRMLVQPPPRAGGVRSGWSGRAIGLFLASAGLVAMTLLVLSTRCACHRCRSGAHPEEEFVQMELVADDVPDRPPEGSEGPAGDPAVPSTEPSSRAPFMASS